MLCSLSVGSSSAIVFWAPFGDCVDRCGSLMLLLVCYLLGSPLQDIWPLESVRTIVGSAGAFPHVVWNYL